MLLWAVLLGAARGGLSDDTWGATGAYMGEDFYGRYLKATDEQLKDQCGIGAVCLTRAQCNNHGDCVNGACVCDSTAWSGATCQTSASVDCAAGLDCAAKNRAACSAADTSICGACLTGYAHADASGTTECTPECTTVPTCAAQNRLTCTAPNTCGACKAAHATVGSGAAAVCVPCSPTCGGLNRATCANATAPNVCGACKAGFFHAAQNAQGTTACISCPDNCAVLNRAGCSTANTCGACLAGFAGDDTDRTLACSPCVCNSAADCNGKGECRNGVCKCDAGFIGATCLAPTSTYGSAESSQLVKDLKGLCAQETACAGCNGVKKSLGKAVDCIWCPVSKTCLDASDWETDEVIAAREKGEAHKCLGSSTTADCFKLGVKSRPCIFSASATECSAASALGPSALLSALAVAAATLATRAV